MAETKLYKYTEQEKLNKMEVDLIDVTITLPSGNTAAGDVIFHPQKIENAVAEKGGKCMIQSVALIIADGGNDGTVVQTVQLLFTSDSDNTNMASALDVASGGTAGNLALTSLSSGVHTCTAGGSGTSCIGSTKVTITID